MILFLEKNCQNTLFIQIKLIYTHRSQTEPIHGINDLVQVPVVHSDKHVLQVNDLFEMQVREIQEKDDKCDDWK